jgi:putative membrane protein
MLGRPRVDVYASSLRRESPRRDRSADPRPTGATHRADGVAPSVACHEGRLVMMGWYGHGMGAWAWTIVGLFWIVMIGLIVLGTVAVLSSRSHVGNSRDHDGSSRDESATEILDRRFARGDIDEESYRAHRAALMSSRHHVDHS